ncbi:MAG: NFACT family protein [Euryarchaeota archaeon]|nr:NFACT family protein [Euryarchaeota archaeon]
MKTVMTSVDIAALLPELSVLEDARLEKAYQYSPIAIRLKLASKRGKQDLMIEAGRRLHLISTPVQPPAVPPGFPMLLRKELKGARVGAIAQYDFDRIVEVPFLRAEEPRYLICELFSKGNVILTDAAKSIILPLRTYVSSARRVYRGQMYCYPPTQLDPVNISFDKFEHTLAGMSRDLVRTLATRFNMGGLYAEEVCARSAVLKNSTAVTAEEIARLYSALRAVFEPIRTRKLSPHIVYASGSHPIDVLPFEVSQYDRCEKRYFASFNEALDAYFSSSELCQPAYVPPPNPLEKIAERQKTAIEQFKAQELENQNKGDLIYREYQKIDRLIKAVREARKVQSWSEVESQLKLLPFYKHLDPSVGVVTIEVDGISLDIDTQSEVPQNAQKYYEKAKVMREKAAGAERALASSLQKLHKKERVNANDQRSQKPRRTKRKPRWYERFRWFISSDDVLVLGGRDADTNEEIVKKYLEPRDLFMHADVYGAPAVVLKSEGKVISETTLQEAAQFAISYSSVWKQGVRSGRCYWVHPNQVSKNPEPGEYVPKGAFIVRGERHYLESQTQLAVGVFKDMVIGGPVRALRKSARSIVTIEPGKYNQSDIAKLIVRELLVRAKEDERKALRKIITVDDVIKFVPPGTSDILNSEQRKSDRQ